MIVPGRESVFIPCESPIEWIRAGSGPLSRRIGNSGDWPSLRADPSSSYRTAGLQAGREINGLWRLRPALSIAEGR